MSSDEEVLVIDDDDEDDDDGFEDNAVVSLPHFDDISSFVRYLNIYMPNFEAKCREGDLTLKIPICVLPKTQLSAYGYDFATSLLDIHFVWTKTPDYREKPAIMDFSNPVHGYNFIGKPRVSVVLNDFFSPRYRPKSNYDCLPLLFSKSSNCTEKYLFNLVSEGFEQLTAHRALCNSGNDIQKAREMLILGKSPNISIQIPFKYEECPLAYLVFEIIDAFLSLSETCCICGNKLAVPCLKPSLCDNDLCQFSLKELGLGNNLVQEIRRDPQAADYVFSAFANSYGTQFLTPAPPSFITRCADAVFRSLPPMTRLAQFESEAELLRSIGKEAVELLRYVIFSNRNQFTFLRSQNLIQAISCPNQFMVLAASPAAEVEFQNLKARYGSQFLWHGSHYDRWHAIFHNGLINASGTKLQVNGAARGAGIYLAQNSTMSWGYVRASQNKYHNSLFHNFSCIALCEVAKVPELKNHGDMFTLTLEKACIVRFLFIGNNFSADFSRNQLKIPSLDSIRKSQL